MRKIIHHLRRQPEETRRHILHIITISFAVILAILWIYSLGRNITSSDTRAKIGQDLAPFYELKDTTVEGYQIISGQTSPVVE